MDIVSGCERLVSIFASDSVKMVLLVLDSRSKLMWSGVLIGCRLREQTIVKLVVRCRVN